MREDPPIYFGGQMRSEPNGNFGNGKMSQGMMGPGMMGHQAVTEPRNYFEREMGNSYMHEGPSPAFGLNMLGNNGGAFNSGS